MISLMPRSSHCFHTSLLVKWIPTSGRGHQKYLLCAKSYSNYTLRNVRRVTNNNLLSCDYRFKTIDLLSKVLGSSRVKILSFVESDLTKKCLHTSSSYSKAEFKTEFNIREKTLERSNLQIVKEKVSPYFKLMRYDRLTGTYLLYLPCAWSILLAYDPVITTNFETAKMLSLFLLGAYIMRSAGCIINDILDKDIDAKVSRTKDRPLASEKLTNKQAVMLLAGHMSAGLCVLLQLNWLSVFIGAPSVILVALYPLAKRYTHLAQVVLGSVFSWGAILGNTAMSGSLIPGTIVPLYLGALCWIVYYDTIYAHQDRIEDVHLGLKSTAILLSGNSPTSTPEGRVRLRTALSCLSVLTLSGCGLSILDATQGTLSPAAIAMLLTPAAVHFLWQIATLKEDIPEDCASKFKSNVHVGALILAAIIAAKILQHNKEKWSHTINDNILAIVN